MKNLFVVFAFVPAPILAQHFGGSPSAPGVREGRSPAVPAAARQVSAGTWNGQQPVWGGSPPAQRAESRQHNVVYVPVYVPQIVYVPQAVAAPEPVAAPVIADTVYTVYTQGPADMKVAKPRQPPHELTTIEVYRLQPRFRKP